MADKIRVLLIAPMERPRAITIEHTLENLQNLVGGCIQALYPWEDSVGLVACDDGKFNGSLPNRRLEDFDLIFGPFLIVGLTEDDFGSLNDEMMEKYTNKFAYPEMFFRTADHKIMCFRVGSSELPCVIG